MHPSDRPIVAARLNITCDHSFKTPAMPASTVTGSTVLGAYCAAKGPPSFVSASSLR